MSDDSTELEYFALLDQIMLLGCTPATGGPFLEMRDLVTERFLCNGDTIVGQGRTSVEARQDALRQIKDRRAAEGTAE